MQLTLVIIIVGVGLRTWDGLTGKKWSDINAGRIVFTFILSCITGIGLVVPHIEIAVTVEGITGSAVLLLIANQILTVYGADAIYQGKRTKRIVAKITGGTDET